MKKILNAYLLTILCFSVSVLAQIPVKTLVQISRAEDELRYDKTLEDLMKNPDAEIRRRAALAAGRIGNEAAIPALTYLLENDKDKSVQNMAVFSIGEIESLKGADAILKVLNDLTSNFSVRRARAVEAAGKIAAANSKDEKSKILGEAILNNLKFENETRSARNMGVIETGLTAVLRVRPAKAEKTVVEFVKNNTPLIRADALNALARLRAKNANEQARGLLRTDTNAIVRANAARVLGAAEDKDALDALLNVALTDNDSRVRVSAIRSLGNFPLDSFENIDEKLTLVKVALALSERGINLLADYNKSKFKNPLEKSELLEIATTLGKLLPKSAWRDNPVIDNCFYKATKFLSELHKADKFTSPETEIAFARISPREFVDSFKNEMDENTFRKDWRSLSAIFQGVGEIANLKNDPDIKSSTQVLLVRLINNWLTMNPKEKEKRKIELVIPDLLRAFAAFKSENTSGILRPMLEIETDLFIRAIAAELLGEQPATKENIEALKTAFAESLKTDKKYNDAQLAILSALVKLDKPQSFESLRLALKSPDYLVRKHAANLIKENDLTKDFSNIEKMVGTVKPYDPKTGTKLGQILNTEADYVRAVSRKNGTVKAVLTTEKGKFTIELMPEDAPLTVDNFIKLAKSNYFNGVSVHRVVPNFVMQDGDPRGDGNGGPGWQIRCEINMLPYERGAVGMALSGKDTGGSQWFVTHSPQPHLDGGYTVFGKVNEADMKIVDTIVRGDKILKVEIIEGETVRKPVKIPTR